MPVTNLLMGPSGPSQDRDGTDKVDDDAWQGMRLTGALRAAAGVAVSQVKDSTYRPIERPTRHFNPLRVPRKLAADLPFKSQITQMKPSRNETYMQKRAVVLGGEERRARDLMQKLATLRNEKVAKRAEAQEKRREPYRRKVAEGLEKKAEREKREKETYWRREGRKRGREGGDGAGGGKRRKQ
ncbi:hypothetical protein MRB53_040941 [Persea americana]|nr:hypothetical protein MRB53_040941 [Persea americana]